MAGRPLSIPVILGTTRKGRMSAFAAHFVLGELRKRAGVVTELVDIAELPLRIDDAGEAIRDAAFAEKMTMADALVIVSPEYNHSFPGLLKHVLDSCLEQYVHKAAGIAGVSAGPFGGARGIEDLLPVLRELGLVTIFWDLNFGNVSQVFDAGGLLLEPAFVRRAGKFLDELVWMARTLRHGRDDVALTESDVRRDTMICRKCGAEMNHHADKLLEPRSAEEARQVDAALGGVVEETHGCPVCGNVQARRVGS